MAVTEDASRARMVAEQIVARGVADPRVVAAMEAVPRHQFVPGALVGRAYDDTPLPIGDEQTISQPYVVALMCEALRLPIGPARVLEVGTGSGYQAAVLAAMGARVVTVERQARLAAAARALLAGLRDDDRVIVVEGDGTLGWPAGAPYDGIVVAAAAPAIPRPLLAQLAPGARLVLPLGGDDVQSLVAIRREDDRLVEEVLGECRFVRLVGAHGWEEQ
jgi:protein-L-isoaspartate(D-aspartate) O-methyltransferase